MQDSLDSIDPVKSKVQHYLSRLTISDKENTPATPTKEHFGKPPRTPKSLHRFILETVTPRTVNRKIKLQSLDPIPEDKGLKNSLTDISPQKMFASTKKFQTHFKVLQEPTFEEHEGQEDYQGKAVLTEHFTPVKTRTEHDIPSPGAYFMAKSAKCGFLDGFGDAEDRPFFTTPKRNHTGQIIDHLATPFYGQHHADFGKIPLPRTPAALRKKVEKIKPSQLGPNHQKLKTELLDSKIVELPQKQNGMHHLALSALTVTMEFPTVSYFKASKLQAILKNNSHTLSTFTIGSVVKATFEPVAQFKEGVMTFKSKTQSGDASIFVTDTSRGQVLGNGEWTLNFTFKPKMPGRYQQTFMIRCNGRVINMVCKGIASSQPVAIRSTVNKPVTSKTDSRMKKVDSAIALAPKRTIPQKIASKSMVQLFHNERLLSKQDALEFMASSVGRVCTLKLKVCNCSKRPIEVEAVVAAPYSVPNRSFIIQADSFVELPIVFRPLRSGLSTANLLIRHRLEVLKLRLKGIGK